VLLTISLIDPLSAFSSTGAVATFVSSDTSTEGSWHGVYGADGYSVANDSQNLPAYVSFAVQNQLNYTWASPTTDPRALQTGSNTGRISATCYSSSSFDFDVNFTDGNAHRFALYALDWDSTTRAETIQIVDANSSGVLDTRSISQFQNGIYLIWNISGHVKIIVTRTGGANAVINGAFFSGATASFVNSDTITEGSWRGVYGADGHSVANDSQNLPAYVSFAVQNQQNYIWAASTTDPRALQTGSGTGRIASTWYNSSTFNLDVNFTDGKPHRFALYALDRDSTTRAETIQIVDANSSAVLGTRSISQFQNGIYLVWNISGHVKIIVTRTGGANAVISGAFFGGATATFVSSDTSTEGSWHGVYRADGYSVANDSQSLPAYVSFAVQNQLNYTWAASTTDPRALQTGSNTGRIASTWYSSSSFDFDVNFTDGNAHRFALYALDWDSTTRAETIQIVDANSSAVLDTRSISQFQNGIYLVWNISGHVKIIVTRTGGANAVISGAFFSESTGSATASASSLTFGNVNIGSTSTLSVTFTNSGGSNVTVSSVSVSGPGFSASGMPAGLILSPAQTVSLNVTFAPAATGIVTGSVSVVSNASNWPSSISLSGTGVQPAHSVILTWAPSASAVIGYNVYRGVVSGGPYSKLSSFIDPGTTFDDTTVQASQTYYWVVTAVNSSNEESIHSSEVTATIPTP
jgi:hypothetical protein